ncbi:alpha/beta hydrolase [Glycomyces sp. L485]|uniref:alpha/beta hydrolase fold domain-containing protein n=1 Tax=Glycomyces sp. L485 TaxID=2909235 RepID=UPI001F4A4F4F|nr:alpha/beta hydrolase [Glycomyces sp. L485]MCH7230565.1 alpha/beta hydrolase [Glycomyces sp. L485]
MPVHEYFAEMFRGLEEARAAGRTEQEGEALAEAFTRDYQGLAESWDAGGISVEDTAVSGPHGPVPLRTYRPQGPVTGAVLWAHGGGFLAGDLDMPEAHVVSLELARRAGAFVVSVDYRLAQGGVRYPVPIDDVHAAWTWLCGQDVAQMPVALGGASAGAALALATALRARDFGPRPADALLLAYPFAHFPNPALDPAVGDEMAAVPMRFDSAGIEHMVRNYVGRISDLPPDALPGAARLDALAPTRIVVSEYDDLRSSAELLERQLRELGVPVESYLAPGMTHGHLNHLPRLPAIDRSLDFLAGGLHG